MIAILASPAGALLAWAPTVDELPPVPSDSIVRTLDAWDAPPPPPYVWTPSALDWIVPNTATQLRPLAFRWRYTLAEQVAIKLAETMHPDVTVRATLAILRESLEIGDYVDPKDPRTVQGVQYHASVTFNGQPLIHASRVAEILGYDPSA